MLQTRLDERQLPRHAVGPPEEVGLEQHLHRQTRHQRQLRRHIEGLAKARPKNHIRQRQNAVLTELHRLEELKPLAPHTGQTEPKPLLVHARHLQHLAKPQNVHRRHRLVHKPSVQRKPAPHVRPPTRL